MRLTTELKPLYVANKRDQVLPLKGKILGQTDPGEVEVKSNHGLHPAY